MIYALTGIVVLLIASLAWQAERHRKHVDAILARMDITVSSLLTRIQHPQIIQNPVVRDPWVAPDPPRDAAELAQIGQVVPEFVHVGDMNGSDANSTG